MKGTFSLKTLFNSSITGLCDSTQVDDCAMQAAHVKEAEVAFKEAFRLHDHKKSGVTIWKMYAHMKQVGQIGILDAISRAAVF